MSINIFKFGGASISTAAGVRNVANILKSYKHEPLLVVISAMGKTTNALEQVLKNYRAHDPIALVESFRKVEEAHMAIVHDLFPDKNDFVYAVVDSLFDQLRGYLRRGHLYRLVTPGYDFEYDQIVSYGELISSAIVHHYLLSQGVDSEMIDVREMVKTDATYRDARVDWETTTNMIRARLARYEPRTSKPGTSKPGTSQPGTSEPGTSQPGTIFITQGFLGCAPDGNTTTLGREGSDFSAAIFAYALKAKEMTIWKDVPGVMNADPKWMPDAIRIETLSYREAIELAYYGASVIHPKTIRPLENADIRLNVKSFNDPSAPGTRIEHIREWKIPYPIFIRKQNQVLISLSTRDFSFIIEENLSEIFRTLARFRVKVNIMQNSAISFSVCVDADELKIPPLIEFLQKDYETRYNENVELFTIRHYTDEAVERLCADRSVLMELRSRGTMQVVVKCDQTVKW